MHYYSVFKDRPFSGRTETVLFKSGPCQRACEDFGGEVSTGRAAKRADTQFTHVEKRCKDPLNEKNLIALNAHTYFP